MWGGGDWPRTPKVLLTVYHQASETHSQNHTNIPAPTRPVRFQKLPILPETEATISCPVLSWYTRKFFNTSIYLPSKQPSVYKWKPSISNSCLILLAHFSSDCLPAPILWPVLRNLPSVITRFCITRSS